MIKEGLDFSGKVIIITGGSRGIGATTAHAFCELGGTVVISSRKLDALNQVAENIKKELGKEVYPIACHVGKEEDRARLVNEVVNRFGKIDVLINNAATNPVFGPAFQSDEPVFDKIMEVNLKGPFFLSRLVAEKMQEKEGGAIVNVASVAGFRPMPGLGVYSISKAAVLMMTKVLAGELGPKIRVNAVAPGVIKTRFSEALWKNDMIRAVVERSSALGRIGEPEDVVGAVVFLASDLARYITGEVIVIDGGSGLKGT